MFRASRLMIINKSDLLSCVAFNIDRCIEYARRLNADVLVLAGRAAR